MTDTTTRAQLAGILAVHVDHLTAAIRANASIGLPDDEIGMERSAELLGLHKRNLLADEQPAGVRLLLDVMQAALGDQAPAAVPSAPADRAETARLHDEILSLQAELAKMRDLLRSENQRANSAIDRETTAEEAAEEHRLALSEALGLGTGAPWDAIRERAAVLPATVDRATELETENARMRHELEVMYGGAFDSLKSAPAARIALLREAADECDNAGAAYTARAQNEHAAGAFTLMETFLRKANEAEYVATPCDFVACEPGGEPCSTHERLMAHAEGDHELCAPDCGTAELSRVVDETPRPTPCDQPNACDADTGELCGTHEEEKAHAEGEHEYCGVTCEVAMPTEAMRNFVIAKGYPGTKGALAELERRAAAGPQQPAVGAQQPKEADDMAALLNGCPAAHGALGRICELPKGHAGMHTGSGPNGGAVWEGDAS